MSETRYPNRTNIMLHISKLNKNVRFYSVLFSLLSFTANGQLIEKIKLEVSNIQTIPEAHEYLHSHETLQGYLLELKSGTDTTVLDLELLSTSKGDLIDFDSDDKRTHFFFKTLVTTHVNSFRVKYIYLDNRRLTTQQIDSLRGIIFKRLDNGESFDKLAREYSMDANSSKGGDMGWFEEGRMHSEFELNIKKRKVNEVYTVDIPSNKWYYVVKNSYRPRIDKKISVLYIEINNP